MNKIRFTILATLLLFLSAMLALSTTTTLAHETRDVGAYKVKFGWRAEPAVTGGLNGPVLAIQLNEKPVEEAEKTLRIAVSFGEHSKELTVKRVSSNPGYYTADIIPTLSGEYTFRVTGTIGDTQIDETFISKVTLLTDLAFPPGSDLETRIAALEAKIKELSSK